MIAKIIRDSEPIPPWYGVAIVRMEWSDAICYPIPLNIVVAAIHKAYVWLRWGHMLYQTGYEKGYIKGKKDGREYAYNQYRYHVIKEEVTRIFRVGYDTAFKLFDMRKEPDEALQKTVQDAIAKERARLEAIR